MRGSSQGRADTSSPPSRLRRSSAEPEERIGCGTAFGAEALGWPERSGRGGRLVSQVGLGLVEEVHAELEQDLLALENLQEAAG